MKEREKRRGRRRRERYRKNERGGEREIPCASHLTKENQQQRDKNSSRTKSIQKYKIIKYYL